MQLSYFASANSSGGFFNLYAEVFERADRIYVIKGGPGTGKSSLMRRAARAAEARGGVVEYYLCSSDPESIDGVLIFENDEVIGLLDGTAPHVFEPTLVGAREEIVNLGQFWDSRLLRRQKNEISALANKKSAAYRRAYAYLRSCGNLRAVTDSLLKKALDEGKLRAAAERLVSSLDLDVGEGKVLPAVTRAVSMSGLRRLETFETRGKRRFFIGELYGVGSCFLDELFGKLKEKAVTLRVSYDPVVPQRIDGIFIEKANISFTLTGNDGDGAENGGERYINPKRFIHTEAVREIRGEMRYAARLYRDCLDGALHALSEAKVYHFLLEDIYKNAMDFSTLGEFTNEFLKEI